LTGVDKASDAVFSFARRLDTSLMEVEAAVVRERRLFS
jgi:hypothetical protein